VVLVRADIGVESALVMIPIPLNNPVLYVVLRRRGVDVMAENFH
jgi:hypothetical protein